MAALAAILPLLMHGVSCGQDLGFHVVSWLDAAQQLRHGQYPHWAVTPAWNAGEPRFVFYPPLSWLLGAVLTMVMPANATPIAFVFLVFLAAALSMYRLARHFVSSDAALLASAIYIGNPYLLFNAFERSAMAELMAAAWIPLLLLAILRKQPTAQEIALPLALLWLTNAPAAVMSSYMLALVAILRVAGEAVLMRQRDSLPWRDLLRFALIYVTGTALGLALPAFYLVPAAYERRYVQVSMAIIPNMRFQDNFLFDRTADMAHNAVNHTASMLALALLALAVIAISALSLRSMKLHQQAGSVNPVPHTTLAVLTFAIALLLVPLSTPLWLHLPELAFLQFPWRLLSLLSVVLVLALAPLLTIRLWQPMRFAAPLLTLALSATGYGLYAQQCETTDRPAAVAALLTSHHGVGPTDEYTPVNADNDVLRTSSPGYWLASSPNAPAPHTVPTAVELDPSIATDDTPVPPERTLSTPAPRHLELNLARPAILILNLRDFPDWEIRRRDKDFSLAGYPTRLQRDDGLIAISLPSGISTIDIRWRRTLDQWIGIAVSALAFLVLSASMAVQRRRKAESSHGLA